MNSLPDPKDLSPAEDRLMDALLSEHARLGQTSDEELVANILRQTIHASVIVPMASPLPLRTSRHVSRPFFGRSDWLKAAAMVAGIAFLGALLLKGIKTKEPGPLAVFPSSKRQEQVFQLVIQETTDAKQQGVARTHATTAYLSTQAGEVVTAPFEIKASVLDSLDSVDSLKLADSGQPALFGPSVTSHPKPRPVFTLAANESSRNREEMIYRGDVVLTHHDFILKADSIVVDKSGALLNASNASLTHRAGAYQTQAKAVTFSPASGELIARGVQKLMTEGKEKRIDKTVSSVIFDAGQVFFESGVASPPSQ